MKARDVKIGAVYAVKVSGKIQPVKILEKHKYSVAWYGRNLNTQREVYIKSAAKLRYEIPRQGGRFLYQYYGISEQG